MYHLKKEHEWPEEEHRLKRESNKTKNRLEKIRKGLDASVDLAEENKDDSEEDI
jgi:hypothetical protein